MRFLPLTAFSLLLALPAYGQNIEWQDFDVTLGGSAIYHPDYLGSDDYEFGFAPDAELVWQKALFLSSKNGAGIYIVDYPSSRFGISIAPDFGRSDDTNPQLAGLGDVDFGWQMRVFGDLNYEPFIAGASARIGLAGGSDGQQINAYIGLRKELMENLTGQMTVGTSWAGATWGNDYYGVTAAQAASSGLPQYRVNNGFRDAALGGLLSYKLTPEVSLTGSARWTHLLGDFADSPIVSEENNLTMGLGLTYSVATNPKPLN